MSLKRIEIPPPHPKCQYCTARWRRICEEYLFDDEVPKAQKCEAYYESHGYVHLPHIMPSTEQFTIEHRDDCPHCSKGGTQ